MNSIRFVATLTKPKPNQVSQSRTSCNNEAGDNEPQIWNFRPQGVKRGLQLPSVVGVQVVSGYGLIVGDVLVGSFLLVFEELWWWFLISELLMGGSLLASSPGFEVMCVTKADYEEQRQLDVAGDLSSECHLFHGFLKRRKCFELGHCLSA
ncbi:hypothetical protein Droror1_Dr00002372 [Drosera rotundifolia]